MTHDRSAAQASPHSRAAVYSFLAWLFLEQPDVDFIARLQALDIQQEVRSLLSNWPSDVQIISGLQRMSAALIANGQRNIEDIRAELAVEHTRLMRGVASGYGPPPPYECLYRSSSPGGESALLLELAEIYQTAEAILPKAQIDRLDYLGLELDLMRFLCDAETSAWERKDAAEASRLALLQSQFLHQHLLAWVPAYGESLLRQAKTGFYQGVAQLLLGFLSAEARSEAGPPGNIQQQSPEFPPIAERME